MRRRDSVRVKVTETNPVLKVTQETMKIVGVLSALCPQCGNDPYAKPEGDNNVHCSQCEYKGYFRVLSNGFGHGYDLGENGAASYNRLKQRWSKEFDEIFKSGIPARSVLAADHRFDGRKIIRPNFEGTGGNNQRNG